MCRMIVLNNTEDNVTWIRSYVSDDGKKTFCAYDAPSPEAIRRTARTEQPTGRSHYGGSRSRPLFLSSTAARTG